MHGEIKRTVLVVDSEAENRAIFKEIFTDKYHVITVDNGSKALEVLATNAIDIVLLNINMSVAAENNVIHSMKAKAEWENIPIILTNSAVNQSERKALELGADEFIQQPYDPYIICKRVDNLISKYVLQIELYKNRARDAEKENRAKTDFLSRISHDIRTPLNGILGLARLLKIDIDKKNTEALADVQQLELSGYYLLNLINDTLDVSKIESGRIELKPAVCDSRVLFNNISNLIKPNMDAKHIKFHVNAEDVRFPLTYIDIGRVEQVSMNILGNAAKFTAEGGTVDYTVTVDKINDTMITYKIVVKDTGVGISKHFLPHIFEAFAQEEHNISSNLQGTGLGMTITKQLIELMGGEISVDSEKEVGTTFTYTLPMPLATETQIKEWREAKSLVMLNCSLEGKRVLLCEDNQINALIAVRLLENKGMLVDHAPNGKIGVEKFAASPHNFYDLILMDVRMPVMDGIEATVEIRRLPREDAQSIPIIAMTANAFESDVKQVKAVGMNRHISKPIDVEKFFTALEEELRLRRTLKKQVVLVVDDIEINRAIIKESLLNEYVILEAEDGDEALQILSKHPGIDALITDIQMPNMGGIELIRRVRSNPDYKHLTIVANTQFGDQDQEQHLLELGADDFVYKPTTPKIVEIRLRNALKR